MSIYLLTNRRIDDNKWTYFRRTNSEVVLKKLRTGAVNYDPPHFDQRPDPDAALQEMSSEAKALSPTHPLIVTYIHGYNNNVNSAMRTTLAIQQGLAENGVQAVMLCLSWPSDGKLQNYLQDRDDALLSYPTVMFILDAIQRSVDISRCEVNIAVLAHSMGTLMLREGMTHFSRTIGYPSRLPMISETILVAADIDNSSLEVDGSGSALCGLSRRVTTYYNRWDAVLAVGQYVKNGGSGRMGRNGPRDFAALDPKVAAVNCSPVIHPSAEDPITVAREGIERIHSGYFEEPTFYRDISFVSLGTDRLMIPTREPVSLSSTQSFNLHA